jgi:hypothetical protein
LEDNMKALLLLALVPALAVAAPPGHGDEGGARAERMQKRMRLARVLGLAEALDLDDAGVMRARDILARFDAKAAPLRKQLRDGFHVLRDAANGDSAAAGQVEATLKTLRETADKLHSATFDMFQELTQGFTPEKKARAAVFLVHFQEHAARMMRGHEGGPEHGGGGPGMGSPGKGRDGMMMGPHGQAEPGGAEHNMMSSGGSEGSDGDWAEDD